jgi:hypothetical protein
MRAHQLAEAWVGAVKGDGGAELVDVFLNPHRGEFMKLLQQCGILRGDLGPDYLYVFDADCTHNRVFQGLLSQGIRMQSGAYNLNLHFDRDGPFLEGDNWRVREFDDGNPAEWERAKAVVESHPIVRRLYGAPVELRQKGAY